ncbi:MAG: flagellar motor protein MotB [Planctomycetota bacterium]
MAVEEEPDPGIPEWVVTFGDMMSLLLTFFIMLVSMSEIKEEERYQAMLESMRRAFGHESSISSIVPGETTPRNSNLQTLASMGRAKRLDIMRGGNPIQSVKGEETRVQTIRHGKNATTGGRVFFEEGSPELSNDNRTKLREIAAMIAGKPQKIEIRGHTSRKPVAEGDHWYLSYQRCYRVMKFLVEEVDAGNRIDPNRIRLGAAAEFEPIDRGVGEDHRQRNARVEILVWDESVGGE